MIIVCLMIVQNVHMENYANYLIPTLIRNLIWILILIPIEAAWYLSTVGKHLTSMFPKYASVSQLRKLPRGSKNPLCFSRDIFIQKNPKFLDHGQFFVHVDHAESYKISQQNENQSAYFGNSTFSIFTACCYTKSLDNGDLKKDSIVVVNESREHNRTVALTCLKKVVDKAEEINVHFFL